MIEWRENSWPRRYEVRFRTIEGGECLHRVVTWMDEVKAVAMATSQHTDVHGDRRIHNVAVHPRKPVESDVNGTCRLDNNDLTDRTEW
jgi:hypothetical protein